MSNETTYENIRSAIMHGNIEEAERLIGFKNRRLDTVKPFNNNTINDNWPLGIHPMVVVSRELPKRAVWTGDDEYLKRLQYLVKHDWLNCHINLVIPPKPE